MSTTGGARDRHRAQEQVAQAKANEVKHGRVSNIKHGDPGRVPVPPREELRPARPGSAHAICDGAHATIAA